MTQILVVDKPGKTIQTLEQWLRDFLPYLKQIYQLNPNDAAARQIAEANLEFKYNWAPRNDGSLRYKLYGALVEIKFHVTADGPIIALVEVEKDGKTSSISHDQPFYHLRYRTRRCQFAFDWDAEGEIRKIEIGEEAESRAYIRCNEKWDYDGPFSGRIPRDPRRYKWFDNVATIDYSAKIARLINDTNLYHLFVCIRDNWPCAHCFATCGTHTPFDGRVGHEYQPEFL